MLEDEWTFSLQVFVKPHPASSAPAIGESVPGYEASVWYGMAAPKGTPSNVIETLNHAVNAILANPKLQARLAELGGEPMPMTPAGFGKASNKGLTI